MFFFFFGLKRVVLIMDSIHFVVALSNLFFVTL